MKSFRGKKSRWFKSATIVLDVSDDFSFGIFDSCKEGGRDGERGERNKYEQRERENDRERERERERERRKINISSFNIKRFINIIPG